MNQMVPIPQALNQPIVSCPLRAVLVKFWSSFSLRQRLVFIQQREAKVSSISTFLWQRFCVGEESGRFCELKQDTSSVSLWKWRDASCFYQEKSYSLYCTCILFCDFDNLAWSAIICHCRWILIRSRSVVAKLSRDNLSGNRTLGRIDWFLNVKWQIALRNGYSVFEVTVLGPLFEKGKFFWNLVE